MVGKSRMETTTGIATVEHHELGSFQTHTTAPELCLCSDIREREREREMQATPRGSVSYSLSLTGHHHLDFSSAHVIRVSEEKVDVPYHTFCKLCVNVVEPP